MQKGPLAIILISLFFLVGSLLVGWVIFPKVIQNKISSQVRLEEGSLTWDKWRNITSPIFIKFYMFNVTNPDEIVKGTHSPVLNEVGPFVYEQKRLKKIEGVNTDNDTVTYRQSTTYKFRHDLSEGNSEEDIYTFPNMILAGFTVLPTTATEIVHNIVIKNKETLFIRRSVGEMLFKGYYSQTIKDLSDMRGYPLLPNYTFGIYYDKNGTYGAEFEVQRGVRDVSEFGLIKKWKNMSSLDFWGGKYCNMLNGTDGSIFAPFVTSDRRLKLFSEELCRSLYLDFSGEVEHNGIPGLRFSLPQSLLAAAKNNPENGCFCKNIKGLPGTVQVVEEEKPEDDWDADFDDGDKKEEEISVKAAEPEFDDKQCKAGVILLSACRDGKPIAASTPHFLYGEKSDLDKIVGLSPNEEKHGTFIDLEPNTGLVLQATKKIQINIIMKKSKKVHQMNKLKEDSVLFPILWADEYASMTAERSEEFKAKLLQTFKYVNIGKWTVVSVSSLFLIIGLLVLILRAKQSKYIP